MSRRRCARAGLQKRRPVLSDSTSRQCFPGVALVALWAAGVASGAIPAGADPIDPGSVAGTAPAGREVPGREPSGWEACERLDAGGGFPAQGGLWIQFGFRSWEAIPGAMQLSGRAGFEPRRGPGLLVDWTALGMQGESDLRRIGVGGVFRLGATRLEATIEDARFVGESLQRGRMRVLVSLLPGWIFGGSVDGVGGVRGGAPSVVPEAWAQAGTWHLGILVRDSLEAVIGLCPRPGITAFARIDGGAPAAGVVLEWAWMILRAEASDHPHLGQTARVSWGLRSSR